MKKRAAWAFLLIAAGAWSFLHSRRLNAAEGAAQKGEPATGKVTLAVVGGFLIDGFGGPPRPNAVILVEGEQIAAVGEEGRLEVPAGAKVIDANGYTVMPGLIDTHVHLDLLGHGVYPVWHPLVQDEYAEVMKVAAAQLLAHGVTTARDAGGELGASVETREKIDRGELLGPRLLVSGDMLVNWSEERMKTWYRKKISIWIHGAEQAGEATRKLIEGGADFIKIRSPLTVEEIRAVTEEAHRQGKRVGAHVYTEEEVLNAVHGGVDILDHVGSGHQTPLYGDETLEILAETQIPIDPTLAHGVPVFRQRMAWPERMDDPQLRSELGKYAEVVLDSIRYLPGLGYFGNITQDKRALPRAARQLFQAGGKIVLGTDSGTPAFFHSDAVWLEAKSYVDLMGMTPNEAIISATKNAAAALGVNTGVIDPGRLADMILVKGNPLEDISYLQNVEHVIKGGVQYR